MKDSSRDGWTTWLGRWGLTLLLLTGAIGCEKSPGSPKEQQESLASLARKGDVDAQNQYGFDLVYGNGVDQNVEEGLQWIRRAAEQDHGKALYNLAVLHQSGKWVKQDLEQAFKLMFQASRQGLPEAQASLGYMYERGQGTAPDINEAVYWYQRAATFGKAADRSKSHYLKNLLSHRQEQYLHGNRDAQFMLGRLYEEGTEGFHADPEEAVRWYEDAAVRGDTASQARLAVMLGIHGRPRLDQAMGYAWAKLAASAHANASFAKPLASLQSLLSSSQQSMGETLFVSLREQVSYNLEDLDLPPETPVALP